MTSTTGTRQDGATATRRRRLLTVMCVGMFLVPLDVTIVNVALPQIGAGLMTGLAGQQWVVDGYAVVLGALAIAVYGTIAGTPTDGNGFTAGLHTIGLVGAITWLAALGLTWLTITRKTG
jgi:DHA2 family methylenomycin A resistance protein-like MFS transporter